MGQATNFFLQIKLSNRKTSLIIFHKTLQCIFYRFFSFFWVMLRILEIRIFRYRNRIMQSKRKSHLKALRSHSQKVARFNADAD